METRLQLFRVTEAAAHNAGPGKGFVKPLFDGFKKEQSCFSLLFWS
jgi:hypothetical protein